MEFKLKAIREESLLPASSLEAIKGGVQQLVCSEVSCGTNLGGDCTINACGTNSGDCGTNRCVIYQGSHCPCQFINYAPLCPTKGGCPLNQVIS